MRRPVIGVVPLWDENKTSLWMEPGYMKGIENAGGLPLILPLSAASVGQMARELDGFLFTGGHDVDPQIYGEKAGGCGTLCPERDHMERILFDEAVLFLNKPAFGICRGLQLWNALLGGTLYQDIPSQLRGACRHRQQQPYDRPAHVAAVRPDTPLHRLLGVEQVQVNSYHHQGVCKLAPPLSSMAEAPDGLVEAVWVPDRRFAWAVQWHPEFAPEDETSKRLFSAFVRACEGKEPIEREKGKREVPEGNRQASSRGRKTGGQV